MKEMIESLMDPECNNTVREDKGIYYMKIAEECSKSKNEKDIIAGVLLYNQLIELLLKDIILVGIIYIKASIWPVKISINLDLDNDTLGKLIDKFKNYSTHEYNRDIILKYLKDIKTYRNKIVHRLFDIGNVNEELSDYFDKANELTKLLLEYFRATLERIYETYGSFNFRQLLY